MSNVPRQGTQPPMRYDGRRGTRYSGTGIGAETTATTGAVGATTIGSRFHIGVYYDPFGWGYQPFSIGWRLWPNYYSSQYWISDPWDYQLPYAPPGTQWVRYYNDVLLVDMYTGEVVDVIHGFFW